MISPPRSRFLWITVLLAVVASATAVVAQTHGGPGLKPAPTPNKNKDIPG